MSLSCSDVLSVIDFKDQSIVRSSCKVSSWHIWFKSLYC